MDVAKMARAITRVTDAQADSAAAFKRLDAARREMMDAQRAYDLAQCELRESEAALAKLAGINTHGIARKLTLTHARYTKSDVRV